MPLFNQPVPVSPSPKGKWNPFREGDTLKALGETRNVVQKLIQELAPYFPAKSLTDADGRRFLALAQELGDGLGIAGGEPFQLVPYLDGSTQKVKVIYSTLAGEAPTTPTPEGDFSYLFTPSGTQKVYGKITINGTTGEVTTRILAAASSVPADDDTNFHVEIGTMTANGSDSATVANARFGPIDVTICRNWFAAEAPFFGVSFSGS